MGRTYDGAYADLINQKSRHGHEGYGAQQLPDGTLSAVFVGLDEHVAHVAACSCGWTGRTKYPPGDAGEESALAEWEAEHLEPMIASAARTWTVWASAAATTAAAAALCIETEPAHAARLLDQLVEDAQHRLRIARELAGGQS